MKLAPARSRTKVGRKRCPFCRVGYAVHYLTLDELQEEEFRTSFVNADGRQDRVHGGRQC